MSLLTALIVRVGEDVNPRKRLCRHRKNLVALFPRGSQRAVIERIRNVKGEETLQIDPGTVAGVSAPATYGFGELQAL